MSKIEQIAYFGRFSTANYNARKEWSALSLRNLRFSMILEKNRKLKTLN